MNQSWKRRTCIIFAFVLGACNAGNDATPQADPQTSPPQAAPGSPAEDPSVAQPPQPPARPQEKQDSIQLEGMWEPMKARLIQPNASVPFSTYLPEGMEFDQQVSGEGEGFYFYAAFGGKRVENAFMLVFMLPAGATEAQARTLANAFRASRSGADQSTTVRLGSYNGRHFYVASTYPVEYGDGLGPRMHYIRENWVWLNDGKSLNATLQSPLE